VCSLAYQLGWRKQELLRLERHQLDLELGTRRLEPGTTKNHQGRTAFLRPELRQLLAAQVERVRGLERRTGSICRWLFPYLEGPYRGQRISDFRKSWKTACRAAGVPGRLFHDFRRTAVRNMLRRGVTEKVTMGVAGHLSRRVFDRYAIVASSDLQEVARRTPSAVERRPASL